MSDQLSLNLDSTQGADKVVTHEQEDATNAYRIRNQILGKTLEEAKQELSTGLEGRFKDFEITDNTREDGTQQNKIIVRLGGRDDTIESGTSPNLV